MNGAQWIGTQSSAWGLLPLPDSLTTRPAPFLAALTLTAAGAVLRFHARARKAGSVLLLASLGAALVFYAWPSRGEVPIQTIARSLIVVATLGDARFQIGYSLVLLLALSPLLISLAGLVYIRSVPKREQPGVSIAAVWGVPALLLLFVYRAFLSGGAGMGALTVAFFAVLLVAAVSVLAAAVEVLALGVVTPETEVPWPGLKPVYAGAVAAFILISFLGASWVLGRPAPKGAEFVLSAPSTEGDKLFGELLPNWENARLSRDAHARSEGGTGATAQVAAKARGREMLTFAKGLPQSEELSSALSTLTAEVDDLELSGRAFSRLVGDVNAALQHRQMPYYLDPSVSIRVGENGTERIFYMTPYKVKEVHPYRVGRDKFATLLVEPMTGGARVHLGFSRDSDPFALVLASEIARYAERLGSPGASCFSGELEGDRKDLIAACDTALESLRKRLGDTFTSAVQRSTERHELQHQIDGPHLPLSGAVAELLAGFQEDAQDRANRELSAYLAEMTTPDVPPHLTLVHLYPFGVLSRGGAEHRVAVLLLESISGKKLRSGARAVDAPTYAATFSEVWNLSDDDLRNAAQKAYKSHFGADLPNPVRQ